MKPPSARTTMRALRAKKGEPRGQVSDGGYMLHSGRHVRCAGLAEAARDAAFRVARRCSAAQHHVRQQAAQACRATGDDTVSQ